MKEDIRNAKLRRAERELMEEEEEEERRQRTKKLHEDYSGLAELTHSLSRYDLPNPESTDANRTTNTEMLNLKTKKKKKSKNKNKNNNDEMISVGVNQTDFSSEVGTNVHSVNDPREGKKHKDKKKRKDKNKGKDDDLETASLSRSVKSKEESKDTASGYGDSEMASQVPSGPEDDFVLGGEIAGMRPLSADKDDEGGKKTKGSTDDPSGTSSSDKKKVKKTKKKSKNKGHNQTPDSDLL